MAIVFCLWVETESDEKEKAILSYFNTLEPVNSGKKHIIETYRGGVVTADNLSLNGGASETEVNEMSIVGFYLLEHLKKAPDFRYAFVGLDVDGLQFMNEVLENPNYAASFKGFVIRKDIYESMGKPENLVEFNKNYMWNPYEGEAASRR